MQAKRRKKPDYAFSEGLLRQLEARNMSMAKLERLSRLGRGTLARWVNYGDAKLSGLRRIKSVLGCTWEQLLGP